MQPETQRPERKTGSGSSVFAARCGHVLHTGWAALSYSVCTQLCQLWNQSTSTLVYTWFIHSQHFPKSSLTLDCFNKACLEKAVSFPWELLGSWDIYRCTYSYTSEHKDVTDCTETLKPLSKRWLGLMWASRDRGGLRPQSSTTHSCSIVPQWAVTLLGILEVTHTEPASASALWPPKSFTSPLALQQTCSCLSVPPHPLPSRDGNSLLLPVP